MASDGMEDVSIRLATAKLADSTPVATAVLTSYELLENILIFVPAEEYCLLTAVNPAFSDVILRSKRLHDFLIEIRPSLQTFCHHGTFLNTRTGNHQMKLGIVGNNFQTLLIRRLKETEVFALIDEQPGAAKFLTILPAEKMRIHAEWGAYLHLKPEGQASITAMIDRIGNASRCLRAIDRRFDEHEPFDEHEVRRRRERDERFARGDASIWGERITWRANMRAGEDMRARRAGS